MKTLIAIIALTLGLCANAPALASAAGDAPQAAAPVLLAQATPAAETAPAAESKPAPGLDSGDTAWMLVATVLVIIMIVPGLALFYGGMVRAKNVLSVLMQVLVVFSLVSVLWALFGYSLAFSEGNAFIGGFAKAFFAGLTPDSLQGTIPELLFATFQLTFAAITPALIVGAFAERMKFAAVLWFLGLWLFVCYVPVAHMVWGGGWIGAMGAIDFAGGTVVHINAGVAGLVAAIVLGQRKGHGKVAMPPHNLTFTLAGAALLWAGWFGFNAGSALTAGGSAALAMLNTQLATAAAVLGWTIAEWIGKGKPSLLGAASGAIAGLVAITPACGNAGPMGAIVLGAAAGVICYLAVAHLKRMFGYDDALDVFGVHGVGGIVGALGIGFLASPGLGGTGFATGVSSVGAQFLNQVIGVVFTIVYTGIASYALLKLVGTFTELRVADEAETEGLDVAEHGESAYSH